ncbi:hypothetical protein GCM10010168_85720 [Actinoplanes ianthinogenes]|uniref:Uncharacterized protein n=1 Tax=Actinoplanes ianthinogenes TaxID=122358 RepID=A0ABN6CJZ9_9ACTN|nr:hypothetical protein [Actinoplanes ianthinogenes]BCJ45303.1 hypothetical protein Aiant_59600 [Actinoplanes ianthinogenes]GGR53666.1 hypothetical protein GCM10010168_85720 [Actinoplanes ianthinogenes]
MSVQIGSLTDLRPGDIMFGPIGGLVPGVFPVGVGQLALGEVFRAGHLSVRHVGVVVEASVHHDGPTTYDRTTRAYFPASTDELRRDTVALEYYPNGVITAPKLVQAMPRGAEEIELRHDSHWTPRHAYVRLPEDYPGQAEDAAAIARLFVSEKVPYSFASYAALAAWRFGLKAERLARWINRRRPLSTGASYWSHQHDDLVRPQLPAEAICSVLADQAWTLAGKELVTGTRSQIVTPGMLATQLWRRDGVIWGGAGLA